MAVTVPWLVRKSQIQNAAAKDDEQAQERPRRSLTDPVDISSDDSFPASDPPSFTPISGAGRQGKPAPKDD